MKTANLKGRKGFTLVELAVVVVIIGVLAAFSVPRFLDSVERSKASESFNYLSAVRAAQERHQARQGTYSDDLAVLDIQMTAPKYFSVGTDYGRRGCVVADADQDGRVGWLWRLHRDLHPERLRLGEQHDQRQDRH